MRTRLKLRGEQTLKGSTRYVETPTYRQHRIHTATYRHVAHAGYGYRGRERDVAHHVDLNATAHCARERGKRGHVGARRGG